ncbi:MAG: ATP synthase I chain [Syntrophaceae bacterium PtaU1.Bin231]|nr:MAG: ATP synthase I chain [Syntrophaceae bacterium PtaU1.Bin231]HOG17472.1 ATP synthase subunit I [Syntrophales bacterium]HOS78462.1 ATP synthase subunit I [Syntrophales bacterium]
MNRIPKDPLQKRLEWTNWLVLGLCFLAGLTLVSEKFAFGVLLGGLVSIVNFHWLHRDLKKVFLSRSGAASRASVMWRYYLRFAVTGVVLYLIITGDLVNVIGLLIGLSVVIMNIALTVVLMLLSKKNQIEEVPTD